MRCSLFRALILYTTGNSLKFLRSCENQSAYYYLNRNIYILGTFAKLQKTTVGLVISVCSSIRPFVRMGQLGSQWTDLNEI